MDLAAIFEDPRLMLFSFEGGMAQFVKMTRESYAQSIFFDRRLQPAEQGLIRVPVKTLLDHLGEVGFVPPQIRFIHHFAHSGSTLLARALDQPDNLVIREPAHLRQLGVSVGTAAGQSLSANQQAVLRFCLTMLGKRFSPASTVIVKGNVPISLLSQAIAEADRDQPAVLLYLPLEDYCAAVLRTPGHQGWVEQVTATIGLQRDELVGDIRSVTIGEKAAALWYSMIRRFQRLLAAYPAMRSLDANQLFERPAETIAAASNLLGAGLDSAAADAVASGPLLSTYSKDPNLPFDNKVRRQRSEEAKARLINELRLARTWVEERMAECDFPTALDRPLTRELSPLLGSDS